MSKKLLYFFCCLIGFSTYGQTTSNEFRSKLFQVSKDTIQIDSVSINPQKFNVFDVDKQRIHPKQYQIDYNKAQLIIDAKRHTAITVEYYHYPNFVTKTYSPFNKQLIVPNTDGTKQLYSLTSNKKASDLKLFDGLNTKGFITRGLTVGNNQNAVTNSSLDLNIEGKLSQDITLRANIFDTNIPLQNQGYSQNVTDFDRIFVELSGKKWRVRGGDLSLNNKTSYFLKFDKQISGLEAEVNLSKKTTIGASGAIVRGVFTTQTFTGIEGNQGPYKLVGPNNQPNIIIIGGSERIYINGIQIKRGSDYTIDYNISELRFNTTHPITNDMRIRVEFQFSDRNYTRFFTYNKAEYLGNDLNIAGYFYSENDAKSSPIEQNLTDSQKQILANAGNDPAQMVAESAFEDTFSDNKVLYRKTIVAGVEIFENSIDQSETLFTVNFTNVGTNQGDYNIDQNTAIGTVFKYIGPNLGSFAPVTRLIAPTKLQIAVIKTDFKASKSTKIDAELGYSNQDLNLFSTVDDNQNQGFASKLNIEQTLIDSPWKLTSAFNNLFINKNFRSVQRFQAVEFNRDWNLTNPQGNQSLSGFQLLLANKKHGQISYQFNQLSFSDTFNGSKHTFTSNNTFNKTTFGFESSFLNSSSAIEKTLFNRFKGKIEQSFTKTWAGGIVHLEENDRKNRMNNDLFINSHRFNDYEIYLGIGDSTKVFAKFGYNYRENDSILNNKFTEINRRNTYYLNSQLIQNKTTNLSWFANFRETTNNFKDNEKSLNTKLTYNQLFWQQFLNLSTIYETSSGNLAQQDYVYIETEPGQGFYTWNDYNNNGIKEFNEFEIAQFKDQANYLRVPLPNLTFLPTQYIKWQQNITLNPAVWRQNDKTTLLQRFYNQSYFLVENTQKRQINQFNLNPFDLDDSKLVALNLNFRNQLYFNKNRQNLSLIYTFGRSTNKQLFNIGNQENNRRNHQLEYIQKLTKFWLFNLKSGIEENDLQTENFSNRNYTINTKEIHPEFSYEYNKDHKLTTFYQYRNKKNTQSGLENLLQQQFGLEYFYLSKKQNQIQAKVTMFLNDFSGNPNTPVGFQLLEGLEPGKNYTWSLLINQKINSFLNLSLNYIGRKSPTSKTIHTGTIQLRASF